MMACKAHIQDNDAFTEAFSLSNGVKLGRVLAPTLFSIMCTSTLTNAFEDSNVAININ